MNSEHKSKKRAYHEIDGASSDSEKHTSKRNPQDKEGYDYMDDVDIDEGTKALISQLTEKELKIEKGHQETRRPRVDKFYMI